MLEAYAGKSAYPHHGERVVQGQRLTQPASDLFLGWATGPTGRHFYMRQLRDVKLSALVETSDAEVLSVYASACGWVMARAHAKAGDPWMISSYHGKGGDFDVAMGTFALSYADQVESDHGALRAVVRAGKIDAQLDPEEPADNSVRRDGSTLPAPKRLRDRCRHHMNRVGG